MFIFPVTAQDIFLGPTTPGHLVVSIHQVDRADTFDNLHDHTKIFFNMHEACYKKLESSPYITCTRALMNVIACMMYNITGTRALPNVIKCMMLDITHTKAFRNVITCTMYNVTCTRAVRNVTTCTMHEITCTRALSKDIT